MRSVASHCCYILMPSLVSYPALHPHLFLFVAIHPAATCQKSTKNEVYMFTSLVQALHGNAMSTVFTNVNGVDTNLNV